MTSPPPPTPPLPLPSSSVFPLCHHHLPSPLLQLQLLHHRALPSPPCCFSGGVAFQKGAIVVDDSHHEAGSDGDTLQRKCQCGRLHRKMRPTMSCFC
ncbi:hypothetical protein L6452_35485 [Arctium lappa]|uniref:Uncharacterized protein n=1 Tax=Arctium lappa TaxID=4217 RepID=A0ACB8Y6K9_ARCLA|nr:hypothetical protein L6452_35485 [Arctium lappa]